MTTTLVAVAGVLLLLALAAFLGASETVLTRTGVLRALRLSEDGRRGSSQLLWLVEHPARGLNVLLLLTISSRVVAAGLVTALTVEAGPWPVAAAIAALAVASFVLAEVAPRTYTLRHLDRVGLVMAPVVVWLTRALQPVVRLLVAMGSLVAGRARSGPFTSDQELRRLMQTDDAEEQVQIEEDERQMIHSIFELGDTVCREIMVPRPHMVTVGADEPLEQVVRTAVTRGYSRIPVWRGERDRVVGVIYAKDLLELLSGDAARRSHWTDLLRTPTFVPESKRADDLLRELQRQQVHLAIVVDEHGGLAGLITIEDILEEIVGEIVDEYDHEEPSVAHVDARRLLVTARTSVHDLNELLGARLPEEEGWDSVGGLVIGLLGRLPEEGESVEVEGFVLEAARIQGRRVEKVLVTLPPEVSVSAAQVLEAGT